MPEGFQTLTPDGYRQLDNTMVFPRLEQKWVLDETGWAADSAFGYPSIVLSRTLQYAGLSMANSPVVALSCATGTFAYVSDNGSGGVQVKVYRTTGAGTPAVTVFLFSTRPPPDPGYGWALYNNGAIVFSLLTPILRPLGTYDQTGYSGVSLAGRSCAHVPQRLARNYSRDVSWGGLGSCTASGPSGSTQPGYQQRYVENYSVQMVSCTGSTLGQAVPQATTPQQPLGGCSLSQGAASSTGYYTTSFRSLIVDVTNY